MELNKTFNQWDLFDELIDFLVVAGPCSAESEEQMLDTARQLKANGGIHLFRSGIWKPRTRPGTFEGYGEDALKWLKTVKQETGLHTTVEVASAAHVELALKYDVDVLWLGARTTVNPFSVQEIADSLRGTNARVMVKNPMNPDLSLWIGSIERLYKVGINKLAAIHRGFSTHEVQKYRNMPMWNIPIELKRQFPNLPLIMDPSHIAGNRDYLQGIAQRGINFGFDGMIVEVHNNPSVAMSDKEQQLTPTAFKDFVASLEFKSKEIHKHSELDKHRSSINELDSLILSTISDRMKVAKMIGEFKKANNLPILDLVRYSEIVKSKMDSAEKYGLTPEFVQHLYELIHSESLINQE